ncbi:MAG TPA: sigma-54 dependent transcriptional regulator [Planctomycetaceae bacterium]|nr:sigma-54 dependent transcriptional regulator [Planctomycetaceae bacterium]
MLRILLADDEQPARVGMARALRQSAAELLEAADGPAALEAIRTRAPDLVFLDLNMPGLTGQSVLRELGPAARQTEIVVVTANDSIEAAVECIRLGASDYITKPFEVEQLRAVARRVARRRELEDRVADLQSRLDEQHACGALIGASRPMRDLFARLTRAARAPLDVLIRGETGTGKELIAREIHRLSDRSAGPFVAVNTAAIAASLAESELFGHVKGAFTGAASDRAGVFEQAHGGTLFLDEIGDMPLEAQTKILRALQERAVQPVGSSRLVAVDVRVICATHQDLEAAIAAGRFRQDLYYRVRGIELIVPPLRSRREDVLLLANYFLERATTVLDPQRESKPETLSPEAIDRLLSHPWPGNVRELEQAIASAAALAEGPEIRAGDLPFAPAGPDPAAADFAAYADLPLTEARDRLTGQFERWRIAQALEAHAGNISAAARALGIHRQTLQQKMVQLGIGR